MSDTPHLPTNRSNDASNGKTYPPSGYMPRPPRGDGIRAFGILGGGCLGVFILILLIGFGLMYVAESAMTSLREKVSLRLNMPNFGISRPEFTEELLAGSKNAESKIVIIELNGVIFSGDAVVRQIRHIRRDSAVRAVVLRVDSPGGTVAGSDLIHHHLTALRDGIGLYESDGIATRKVPIVVSMGSVAASGGYYAAMSVGQTPDTIFAEPMTLTGSIGVLIPHYDLSPLMEKIGAVNDSIVSHPMKNAGSMTKPMTAEERVVFQSLVDEITDRFREVVRGGRRRFAESPSELEPLATGRIYTAKQALDCGLIDRIGFLEDAVNRAIELSGTPPSNVKVVRYRIADLLSDFLSMSASATGVAAGSEATPGTAVMQETSVSPETMAILERFAAERGIPASQLGRFASGAIDRILQELATPQAWMLWTTMPGGS